MAVLTVSRILRGCLFNINGTIESCLDHVLSIQEIRSLVNHRTMFT